jgi:hypothetical protein
MAEKKFTLLELHLGDGTVQIGPATIGTEPDGPTEPEATDAHETGAEDAGGCPGRTAAKVLLVVAVIALAAGVARKLLGGDEELEELEELADLDEE